MLDYCSSIIAHFYSSFLLLEAGLLTTVCVSLESSRRASRAGIRSDIHSWQNSGCKNVLETGCPGCGAFAGTRGWPQATQEHGKAHFGLQLRSLNIRIRLPCILLEDCPVPALTFLSAADMFQRGMPKSGLAGSCPQGTIRGLIQDGSAEAGRKPGQNCSRIRL